MTTKTTIDWLRVRTKDAPGKALEALRPMFEGWGAPLTFGRPGKGALGFRYALPVMMADVPVGRMDFGGDSQRGWTRIDVPGAACALVKDWDAIEEVERLDQAELRRTDIALTTWQGEQSHEGIVQAHAAGLFTTRGRPPGLEQRLFSDENAGRTAYIGARDADKFFRGYDKGKEMAAKMGHGLHVTHIDGFRIEDIYRSELELKAQTSPIPWEVIERRDQYFAGAYPYCAQVLPGIEPDILQRRPERIPQRELVAMFATVRHQYGKKLFTALVAKHGDIGAVWSQIVGKEHCPHLLSAGVLLVDHD